MYNLIKWLSATILLASAGAAQAALVDLKAEAEPGGLYGESAWQPFSLLADFGINVDIYGVVNGQDAYAYMDANGAGMGVCGDLVAGAAGNTATNSGSNLCDPSSDDNATAGESLRFEFHEDVVIDMLWFNNNHDGDTSLLGDTISIFGVDKMFSAADEDSNRSSNGIDDVAYQGPIAFSAGDTALISYDDEEFYLSAFEIRRSVPEPLTLGLLAIGLAGVGLGRRSALRR